MIPGLFARKHLLKKIYHWLFDYWIEGFTHPDPGVRAFTWFFAIFYTIQIILAIIVFSPLNPTPTYRLAP